MASIRILTILVYVIAVPHGIDSRENDYIDSDPIVAAPSPWPVGTYGLLMPTDGCPSTSIYFYTGQRKFDTEDSDPNNNWSSPCHLGGWYGKNNMELQFCIKTVLDVNENAWPAGEYCIFRFGGSCPYGMSEGRVGWDDEDSDNENSHGGTLPDGVYDSNTHIDFCCQTSGSASASINLPTNDNFMLFQYNQYQCQEVDGMRATSEWFRWDTEDRNNEDYDTGSHPYKGVEDDNDDIKLHFCYYERI
ncbi:uncharacterized protein [Amphiura filiformis]|uniref:uncharacterized protein n=1 Tax=Amphiura filiformis TaxID=82378 RepID=UPI003B21DCF2